MHENKHQNCGFAGGSRPPPLAAARLPLGDDLHFIGLCGFSNLLFFLYTDERHAFLK